MTPDPLILRPAEPGDWPAVEALLQANGLPIEGARAHLASFVLAIMEGAVVGSSGLELYGDEALLRSVAVAPGRHGQGIGARLLERLIRQARSSGLSSLHLLTTTAPDYFARYGFRTRAIDEAPSALAGSAEFSGACPASALFMSLDLAATAPADTEEADTDRCTDEGANHDKPCRACRGL